jgi:ferric iron reductase protein FhuF
MMLSSELADGIPVRQFFEGGAFADGLETYSKAHGVDRRAAASFWSLYYFSALSIPYIVARRAELALPIGIDEMTIALGDDGLPRAFGLPRVGDWCESGAPTEIAMPLVIGHLGEVIARLKQHAGIAPKLGWNNAAVYIDYALNSTSTDPAAGPDPWPARELFEEACLPDGSPNPFKGCLRHEMDGEQIHCRRKVCCLRYMLPGIPSCGELCALPAQRKH